MTGQRGRARIPSTGTRQRLANNLLERLNDADARKEKLELLQLENDHKATDAVPGLNPKTKGDGSFVYEDGKLVFLTYGEAFAEIDAGRARLWEHAQEKDVAKLVTAMLRAHSEAADAEADDLG